MSPGGRTMWREGASWDHTGRLAAQTTAMSLAYQLGPRCIVANIGCEIRSVARYNYAPTCLFQSRMLIPTRAISSRLSSPLCIITLRDLSTTEKMLAAHSIVGIYGSKLSQLLRII